ncbi:MAG: hypothetical protein KF852_07430, partial [Saprospiraceae bacterium]|nr:hypothetical protein [Saprospiraceae bacterium]
MLFLNTAQLHGQNFCGEIKSATTPHEDSIVVAQDRFGNSYTASDLAVTTIDNCNSGFFDLDYPVIGDFSAEERSTICEVFHDLSAILGNPANATLLVRIIKVELDEPTLATGSAHYSPTCGFANPLALEALNGRHAATLQPVMILEIDSETTWHTTDNDPLQTSSNLFDLYSVVLHEAIHGLGFGSRIGLNGNPIASTYYASYDRFLQTDDSTPVSLLVEGGSLPCCDSHTFNTTALGAASTFLNSIVDDCGTPNGSPAKIVFNEGSNFPTINAADSYLNALSHLDEVCDNLTSGQYYVMHHEIAPGQTRRELHDTELDILRHLGYVVDEENNTGYDCVISPYADNFNNFSIVPGQSVIVPFAFLLFNDVYANVSPVVLTYDPDCTTGAEAISVETIDTDNDDVPDAFRITGISPMTGVRFCYTINCDGRCRSSLFGIRVFDGTVVPDCDPAHCDNLICNGDFEAFTSAEDYYWAQADLPPFFTGTNAINGNNSPDIAFEGPNSSTNTNQFIRLRTNEAFHMPLAQSVPPGCTLRLSFRAGGGLIPSIWASEFPPCLVISNEQNCESSYPDMCIISANAGATFVPHCISGGSINPPGSAIDDGTSGVNGGIYYSSSALEWESYQIEWVNNTGTPMNWITFNGNNVVRIDDIVVTKRCPVNISITGVPETVCIGEDFAFCFDVCAVELTYPDVQIVVNLPTGFELVAGPTPDAFNLAENGCTQVCVVIRNTSGIPVTNAELGVNIMQCDTVVATQTFLITETECFACTDCSGSTIGTTGELLKLSDALTAQSLPANGTDIEVCVAGTLYIDQSYNMLNSTFIMLPGSRIEIEQGSALTVINSHFFGCDTMWRGMELQKGAELKMNGSSVADAQYSIYIHPAVSGVDPVPGGTITGNIFKNNFVGFFVPETAVGKIEAMISANYYVQTSSSLLPPYSGQTSAPENLPQQNTKSLAGMIVNDLAAFTSSKNIFEQLSSGLVSNRSMLLSVNDYFANIQRDDSYYPAWIPRGVAVSGRSNGAHTAKVELGDFKDCTNGIVANINGLTAEKNIMRQVDRGILNSLGQPGGFVAKDNRIEDALLGINSDYAFFAGTATVVGNFVSTDTENAIAGIRVSLSQMPINIDANRVEVKKSGSGIQAISAEYNTYKNNEIKMAEPASAYAGFDLQYLQKSLLETNTVLGSGATGADNIALRIASSPGNVYCCNTLDNTRLGTYVSGGSVATDNFRGTHFSNHAISLLLPDVNAILGSQKHTQNCWGANAGAAVYGMDLSNPVPLVHAQEYPFTVDPNPEGNECFLPEEHAPMGWFQDVTDTDPANACDVELCMLNMFDPESDDVKRIALGDTAVAAAVMWELQRYIYGRLQGESVQNASILAFLAHADTNSIGAFYAISRSIAELLAADSLEVAQLQTNLEMVEEKLDSIVIIDELLPEADSLEFIALQNEKNGLLNTLYDLAGENQDIAGQLLDFISDEAGKLRTQNDSIAVTEIYEINEKGVNEIYLSWLSTTFGALDSVEMAALTAIAEQCPFEGGNAVYRARAFLAALRQEYVTYNDSLLCAPIELLTVRPDNEPQLQIAKDEAGLSI